MRFRRSVLAFAKNGAQVVSIDLNKNCTKIIKIRACEEEFLNVLNADVRNSPFRDKVFDILVCNDVIEHIPNVNKFFAEISRLLKSNGLNYMETPNKLSPYIITSGPHSGLPFVVLLPKRIADPFVWKWSKVKNTLYYNATYLKFVKKFIKNGIEIFIVDLSAYLKAAKTPTSRISPSSRIYLLIKKL